MLYIFANELMNYYRNLYLKGELLCVYVSGVSPYMSSLSVTEDTVLRHILLLPNFVPK